MAMISTCPKFEDTTAMDLTCAKIQKISGNLQEDLSATTTHESDVIRLVLEIAGFEYEEASNKIRYWEELCNNLTHVGLPESTIITFIFLCLRDLNQLRELLQTAEILPRLANVRFARKGHSYLSWDGHFPPRLRHEVRTMIADYGRKLVEKPSKRPQAPFPFLYLPDELQCMVIRHAMISDKDIPLACGKRYDEDNDWVDFEDCCGTCGGDHERLCFCRVEEGFTWSSSCTCSFPCSWGLFATSKFCREEAMKIFFPQNRFSISGHVWNIGYHLEDHRYEHLHRMKHLSIRFNVGWWDEIEIDGDDIGYNLNKILEEVSSKCQAGVDVYFCVPFQTFDSRYAIREQLKDLELFGQAMLDHELTNCSILADDIFGANCPNIERWYDGKVHRVRMFGPGITQSIDDFFAHLDEEKFSRED